MNKVNRRQFLGLLGAGAATAILPVGCSRKSSSSDNSPKYNVLLITLDTTRTEHLSCYGYEKLTSPNLDQLAHQGTKFDVAIATSGATPMSHASILTGLNPYQHGVRIMYAASGYKLPDSVPTLATVLRGEGWKTGAFLSAFPVSEFYGFGRGFDTFDNGMQGTVNTKMRRYADGKWRWGVNENQRRSDQTTEAAIKWIHKTQRPFFTWIHYWDPHDSALIPPAEIVSRFVPNVFERATLRPLASQQVALYDAEIFYMDSQFGRLLQTVRDIGQYENTITVVIADHGEGLNDGQARHGWWYHRLLYQEQIRVPLILCFPDGPAGHVVSNLARSIDIFPTILEILQIHAPKPVEGRSLLGLVNNKTESPRIAYAESLSLYDLNSVLAQKRPKDGLLYCAMDRSWKLIYRPRHPDESELYNLDADPLETKNLYKQATYQARRLQDMLNAYNGYVDKPFEKGPTGSEALEALRSLGYVGDNPTTATPSP